MASNWDPGFTGILVPVPIFQNKEPEYLNFNFKFWPKTKKLNRIDTPTSSRCSSCNCKLNTHFHFDYGTYPNYDFWFVRTILCHRSLPGDVRSDRLSIPMEMSVAFPRRLQAKTVRPCRSIKFKASLFSFHIANDVADSIPFIFLWTVPIRAIDPVQYRRFRATSLGYPPLVWIETKKNPFWTFQCPFVQRVKSLTSLPLFSRRGEWPAKKEWGYF